MKYFKIQCTILENDFLLNTSVNYIYTEYTK